MAAAIESHPGFTIPDPLVQCSTEGCEHAAFYQGEGGFWCGVCGPRVSIFRLPMNDDDVRQVAADAALAAAAPMHERVAAELQRLEADGV